MFLWSFRLVAAAASAPDCPAYCSHYGSALTAVLFWCSLSHCQSVG